MKIGFNLLGCGLGNNGGSRTIIKCNEVLNKLGHSSFLISDVDNFTWFKHEKPLMNIPSDLDVLIATANTTIQSTLSSIAKKKAWYIRLDTDYVKEFDRNVIVIVNSNGLRRKVEELGGQNIEVVYQGIDSIIARLTQPRHCFSTFRNRFYLFHPAQVSILTIKSPQPVSGMLFQLPVAPEKA